MTSGGFAAGLVGVVLDGRYRLDAVLGEGGMGSVFRAQHLAMDRRVAVKLLKPHLTQDATASARFLREARATMKVDSPHAVKVLDFGITPHGDYYMALEYLDGRTVQRELDVDGPFAPQRVLHIARHALHALSAAHRIGLVHRDIKPDNILLMKVGDDADHAKLLDFGVAKLMEGTALTSQSALQLTQAGMVFGTPEFMSPEQACGHPLDGRSDLYSLAACMFAMLTGCALFEGNAPIELLTHHVRTPPPPLASVQPELAQFPELDRVLQRCLAKKREDRPADADAMARMLEELEAYVRRGGASAASSKNTLRSPAVMSASAYFPALPPELTETLPPPTANADLDEAEELPARSRGPLLALIGLGVVGALIAVAVLALGGSSERAAPGDAAVVAAVPDAAIRVDAAPVDAAPILVDAAPSIDAAVVRKPADKRPARGDSPHLAAAEAALREGNRLRQLAEADLALADDPRNVRAKYLLADALIKGGDTERGCTMLRNLGRYPLAIARANAANCP